MAAEEPGATRQQGSPVVEEVHDEFFSEGDEGRYDGGPATVAEQQEHIAAIEAEVLEHGRGKLVRTPEQEARRAAFVRLVVKVVGSCVAVLLVAIVWSQMKGGRVPEGAAQQPGAVAMPPLQAPVAAEQLAPLGPPGASTAEASSPLTPSAPLEAPANAAPEDRATQAAAAAEVQPPPRPRSTGQAQVTPRPKAPRPKPPARARAPLAPSEAPPSGVEAQPAGAEVQKPTSAAPEQETPPTASFPVE